MPSLKFDITGDNKNVLDSFNGVQQGVRRMQHEVEQSGQSIESMFNRIQYAATVSLAGFSVKEFVQKVAQVRGEFQQLEVAFTTMLGSAGKANELMQQLTRTAASTPFDLQGVANGAKQLLAYGVAADKVNDTLVHLGDIAAGLSIPLNDLVMLYGTTMTQGRMFTQDLRQFMGRGIPLADELAKQFGVTKDKVGELVTAGKVGAEEFNRAIMSMSSEGGRFAGLMDAQSKTIAGQISNIEDAIDMMFNEIGQKNEGLINDVLGGVSYLVENYEKVGQAILTVALAYGEWKAAEMLLAATTSAVAKQRAAIDAERVSGLSAIATEYNAVIAAEESEAAAETANTAAKGANVSAIDAEIASLGNLLTARLTEAEAALAAAEQESILAQNRLREAQLSTAAYEQQYQAALLLGDGEKIEAAENALNTAASNENAAAKAAQSAQDNVAAASKAKEAAATQLATFQTKVDTVNKQANTAATGLWAAATRSVTAALHSMKAAMASNPFGLVLVAITSIISLLTLFRKETEESTEALDKLRDAALGSTQKLATYRAVLENVDKKSAQYKKTIQDLNAMADEYHTTLFTEKDSVDELTIKYNELTDAIRANAAERVLSEAASKATKDAMEAEKNAMTELMEDAADATYHKMEEVAENVDGVWINVWKAVEKESFNIRNVTSATWNQISAIIMENARKMSDAFEESPEKGKAAVNNMVSQIEGILKSLGVTDKEIEEFHDSLYEYVESSAKGFKDAYNELGRTEAQLRGIANAAKDTKDITNDAIDKMNYEQLQEHLKKVQTEIDEINTKPVRVDTDNTRLVELRLLLQEINSLLPNQLTVGSDAELEKRLKEAREQRDKQVFGSEEWKKYNSQVSQLSSTLTTHKKSYAENSSRTTKDASSAARERAKLQKEQQEYIELIEKQRVERERAATDLELSTSQAQIDIMEEGSNKTLAQIRLDFEKQKEEIERGYADLKQKKIDEARQLWEANPANKGKVFDISSVNTEYTEAEVKNHEKQLEALDKERDRALENQYQQEAQALRDYLQEYGTFQEKKLALAEEYAEKIRKAQSNGERLSLQREFEAKKNEIDTNRLLENIDMASVFGDFGLLLSEPLKQTVEQLRKLTQTEAFKNRSFDEQKTVFDAIEKAEKSLSGLDSLDFDGIGNAMVEYNAALSERVRLEGQLADAAQTLAEADGKLIKARQSGDEAAIELAKHEYDEAEAKYNLLRNDYAAASTRVAESQAKATQSLTMFQSTLEKVDSSIRAIYNGSLRGIWDLLGSKLQSKIGGLVSGGLELQNQFDSFVSTLTKSGVKLDDFASQMQSKLGDVFSTFTDETTLEEAKNAVNKMIGKVFEDTFGDDDKFDRVASKIGSLIGDLLESGAKEGTAKDTAQSIGQTIGELLKNVGKAGEASGNLWGAIIGVVLQLLDEFAEHGLGRFVETLLKNVGNAVSGILGNIFQDLIPSLGRGIGQLVAGVIEGVVNLVSAGAAGSFLTGKDHEEEYKKGLEDWKSAVESNTYAVEQLTKKMSDKMLTPQEVQKERDAALSAVQGKIASLRGSANYVADDSSNNWFSGYHSWYYKRNDNGFDYNRFNNALAEHGSNTRVYSAQDVVRLSPEDIQILRTYVGDAWADYFSDVGSKQNPNDVKEFLEQIGDLAEKDKEIMGEWYASLTNMTFDALRDNFKNTLKDMGKDRDAFMDDFEEMMFDALLDEMMSTSGLNKALQEWQKQWGEFIASGNDLSKDEVDELRRQYETLIQQGLDLRDKAAQATGYEGGSNPYEQNATSGGWQSMGQDTADELNGRFTALQMSGEKISEGITAMMATLAALSALADGRNITLVEIRNLMITNNAYLEDILTANKEYYRKFDSKLDKIVTQTK